MKKPIFSILTPTHNRAKDFLAATIKSVQKQKEDGFTHEHIIVDNDSTDNTAELVKEFAREDKRIIYIKNNRNFGPGDALNIAFKKSKGEFIVPLDDDDLLPRSSLQIRHDFFQKNKRAKWSYGFSLFIKSDDKLFEDLSEYSVFRPPEKNAFQSLLKRCFIPNGTVTIRRACVKLVGKWGEKWRSQDYDYWLRLAEKGIKPHLIKSYLCLYRVHPNRITEENKTSGGNPEEGEYYKKRFFSKMNK
jgi:teichuronic acid biosynthesis glycosyltransferase TuaG